MREYLAYGLSLDWPHCPAGVELVEVVEATIAPGRGLLGDSPRVAEPGPVRVFRCKSADRIVINRRLRNLENCLVVDFVNASLEGTRRGSLAKFISDYGFPGRRIPGADGGQGAADAIALGEVAAPTISFQQYLLRSVLKEAGSGDAPRAVAAVNEALRRHDLDEAEMWRPSWLQRRPPSSPGLPPLPYVPLKPFGLTPALDFSPDTHKPMLRLGANNLYDFMMMECASVAAFGAHVAECQHCGNVYLTGPMTGRRSTSVYCREACAKAAGRRRAESATSGEAL